MGKFYEDLATLNELVKKLEKKDQISQFIIRAVRYALENPTLSVHQVIKDVKKDHI